MFIFVVILMTLVLLMLNVVIVDSVYKSVTYLPDGFEIIMGILFLLFMAVLDVAYLSAVVTLIKLI